MEEEDELLSINERLHLEKSKYMFFPDTTARTFWDMITFVSIIYQCMLLPFRIAFNPTFPATISNIDIAIDILFIIDIFLNFNTGIYDRGILIMQRKMVIKKYIR